jgi:hypothetical protein
LFPVVADAVPLPLSVTTALLFSHLHVQEPATLSQSDDLLLALSGVPFSERTAGLASVPDIALSVFPTEPPVDPACPNASDSPAKRMMTDRRNLIR